MVLSNVHKVNHRSFDQALFEASFVFETRRIPFAGPVRKRPRGKAYPAGQEHGEGAPLVFCTVIRAYVTKWSFESERSLASKIKEQSSPFDIAENALAFGVISFNMTKRKESMENNPKRGSE